ncbi:fatty acid synthase S-acetyltransferase [Rhizodiscina lignyota]|uniref:Fatty acid synthase S-acetyltransferase n=1 Tax=Rhizodiscina lignyota TaxID=1504668 RepID=A0A9P4I178_9PEZI|nr:fatty acid synthase S-acetyltransferase [Rhizodiscina lignyota]
MNEPIAVVGLDLKFPGDATSPEEFYKMLIAGRSARSETPKDRYNVEAFYHPDPERAGATNVRHAHFIRENIAAFDAPFFSIMPAEAAFMDPQQRGLLECVYRALENAGIPLSKAINSKTSVHVGCFTREYETVVSRDPEVELKYVSTGVGTAMLANRVSWFFDFHGPSITLDTACSSSLNAAHMACTSLKLREASMAIVAGCNLFYNPDTIIPLSSLGFLSPDGKCHSFDHRANGYSRGEGFGTLVLKRLSDAIQDGDTIRAVIRNTGSNQDGRSPGITQPTKKAQADLIHEVYKNAGLDFNETRFFEAHGTGTPVGDPIEAAAIGDVFAKHRTPDDPLYVGALKSNIGHLEGAAGIAGLMKSIYVLERGIIPPNIWFEKLNPQIPAQEWNLAFPVQATVWPTTGIRRASCNSFGYGGSNAHVIMDDAYHYMASHGLSGKHRTIVDPKLPQFAIEDETMAIVASVGSTNGTFTNGTFMNGVHAKPALRNRIFVLSSFDEDGIQRLYSSYREHFAANAGQIYDEDSYLDDLTYTLACKRSSFTWRAAIVANSLDALREALESKPKAVRSDTNAKLAYVFTGQGAQWPEMGRELMEYPTFSQSLQAADRCLHNLGCRWSLVEELTKDVASTSINSAMYSQPLCTALQIALVELLESWSISAGAVVGHSSGEIAAAFAVGAISRESAWQLAYYRGLFTAELALSTKQTPGGMLSVALNADQALEYIARIDEVPSTGSLTVACINSPKNVTISGSVDKLAALKDILDAENIFARKLQVDNAYHSDYMKAIADEYRKAILYIQPGAMSHPSREAKFYSSLTGGIATHKQLQDPAYWVSNLVSPVRFSEATARLFSDSAAKAKKLGAQRASTPFTDVLEIGPHGALRGPLREIMEQTASAKNVQYVSMLKRGEKATETALAAAGQLFCRGHPVDLSLINMRGRNVGSPSLLVDLPSYAFNHSKTYWTESRISKGYRFRSMPRHELLGAPVPDWNPKANAIWRNWIRISENPWIKDHKITGSTLYPAAGMLVMAIEASRHLANPNKKVKGIRFKEVVLHMALRVPTSAEGVETQFQVRPYADSTASTSFAWHEFQLSSHEGDEWREHCRGLVQLEYEEAYTPVDDGLEDGLFRDMCGREIADAEDACTTDVSTEQLYELLRTVGFDFGSTFKTVSNVRIGQNRTSIATVSAADIKSKMPHGYVQPHLIHPTTLDGLLQSVIVALTRGGREAREAVVPTTIGELWIAADTDAIHEVYRLSTKAAFLGLRQAEASLIAVDPTTKKPLVVADGLISTAVSGRSVSDDNNMQRHLCFNVDWKPDPSFVDAAIATKTFQAPQRLLDFDPTQFIGDREAICYMYIRRYFNQQTQTKREDMKPHHQKYFAWMQHQLDRYSHNDLIYSKVSQWNDIASDDARFAELETLLEKSSPEAKLCVAIGKVLPQILTGEVDPLQVMFRDRLSENVYRFATGAEIAYARLCGYLDALAHKNPGQKILEIGAGTGGATVPIMETLMHHGGNEVGAARFQRYDFTDISPAFFEQAREKFPFCEDRMEYRTLNIESDPVQQGFDAEFYDCIIAANVLHATKNITATLRNVRKLLKPGGKLILFEITNTTLLVSSFVFGTTPGWWLSEEPYREWGPLLSVQDWSSHLQRTGFSGVDVSLHDYEEEISQAHGVLISTATAQTVHKISPPASVIVADMNSPFQKDIAQSLHREISRHSIAQCEICPLSALATQSFEKRLCIFIPETETPFLDRMNSEQYASLQRMVASSDSILWLTQGGGASSRIPASELVSGFARAIRAENPALRFVTLSIDSIEDSKHATNATMKIFDAIFAKGDRQVVDNSFFESDGVLHIGRVVEANYMNTAIFEKTTQSVTQLGKFARDPERALKLVVGSAGLLDTLQFDDDPVYEESLPEGEVEFKVMASGLNFLDIMISLGQVNGNYLGAEGSGIVTRTGVNSGFKVGDRVCGIVRGTLKTFARALETSITKMPDDFSFTAAAALPLVYATAYAALYDIANIQKGESVLVHAAGGGVGQACIQLAQLRGAEVFATVGSIEKRDLLESTYGIPRDHILSSRDLTFASGIKRMTKRRGVDVVVNSLSGAALRASWDCIAPFGRFVEIGKVDIYSSARLNMEKFKTNVSFEFVDIDYMAHHDGPDLKRILEAVMSLIREEKIREPSPTKIYPFSKIQEAFRYMQTGSHSGKIVIEPHDDDEVPIVPSRKPKYQFDAEATYVIAGGLGGLGRSMARWMVRRGASNLILLSRSGASRTEAKELVAELEGQGVKAMTPVCDVSDKESLASVISECLTSMPPIKGCIQGSMVLRDSVFENMSADDWHTAVRPKVQGSCNLHEVLPKELDFFILLSSTSGVVGNRGQANYCAGNSYEDALARYRVSNGLKATSLDLGMILSVGYVADNPHLIQHLRGSGFSAMREEEYHALLDDLCNPNLPQPLLLKAQISLGIEIPELLRSEGIDEPGWMSDPIFRHLFQIRTQAGGGDSSEESVNYSLLLAAVESYDAATDIIFSAFVTKLCKALSIDVNDVDGSKPLHAYGVDSLVAVELRSWLLKELGADVAVFDLMGAGSLRGLASLITTRSSLVKFIGAEE